MPRFRNSQSLLTGALLLGLLLSACSGGGGAPAPTVASGAASTPASQAVPAAPRPTPDQPTGTPASAINPAAQPANGQTEQRSVQAGGDPGGPVSDAPAAPIVARSKTAGRPI